MSIVRELVTRLAFQIDQSGINKVNQTISGFKGGLEGIVSTAFNIGDRVVQFFSGISQEVVAIKDISTAAGIATDRFVALRQAASEFNLKPEQFEQAFTVLNNLLQQASFGQGELFQIANQANIEFRDLNGNLVNTEDLFIKLVTYLGNIGDSFHRQRIAVNLFGQEIGPRISDLATQGGDAISKAAEKYSEFGTVVSQGTSDALKYQTQLNQLTTSFGELKTTIGLQVLPYLNKFLETLNFASNVKRNLGGAIRAIDKELELNFASNVKRNLGGAIRAIDKELELINPEIQQNLIDKRAENLTGNLQAVGNSSSKTVTINMSNSFEFDVPPGTTQEQATAMQDSLKQTLNAHFDEKVRELINNNPQVE